MATRREQLAELLGSLSLATEAAVGVPPETSIRAALVGAALARALGLPDQDCASAYLVALLRYIGCSGFASETAWYGGGDDISLLGDLTPVDGGKPLDVVATIVRTVGHRQRITSRVRSVGRALSNPSLPQAIATAHCAQAVALTESLGMGEASTSSPTDVVMAIYEAFARGDLAAVLSRIDPHAELQFEGPSEVPWTGTYKGRDGWTTFFQNLGGHVDELSVTMTPFAAENDRVVALGRYRGRVKRTGRHIDSPLVHLWTVRHGLVVRCVELTNTAAAGEGRPEVVPTRGV